MNANKIKASMVEAGYTQRSLARELGMSKTTLNLKINKKTDINMSEVARICKILQISDRDRIFEIFWPEEKYG